MGDVGCGLQHGVLHVLQGDLCFTVHPHEGAQLPHHGCIMGCRGINLCSNLEHIFFLPLHWPWGLQGGFSHIFSFLSPFTLLQWIFLLNYVFPPLLMCSSSSRSHLEPPGIGSVRHGGSLWELLTEVTPVFPLYQNLAMKTQSIIPCNSPRNMEM